MPRHSADTAHIRALRQRGLVSPRAAKSAGMDYDYGATSRDGQVLRRHDAGNADVGAVPPDANNDSRFQSGGRVTKSAGAGRERQEDRDHINKSANARQFPVRTARQSLPSLSSASRGLGVPRRGGGTEHYRGKDGSTGTLMGDPSWRQD